MPGFPPSLLSRYEVELQELLDEIEVSTDIELSEAFERVGIGHFFSGVYGEAAYNFSYSLKYRIKQEKKDKMDRSSVRVRMYVGLAFFRLGDPEAAEQHLKGALQLGQELKLAEDIQLLCQSNLSIVQIQQQKYDASMHTARAALDGCLEVHGEDSKQYRDACRLMVSIFLRCQQMHKAERALATYREHFTDEEFALFKAGIKFSDSDKDSALEILIKAQESVREIRQAEMELQANSSDETREKWQHVEMREVSPVIEAEINHNIAVMRFLARDYNSAVSQLDSAIGVIDDFCERLKNASLGDEKSPDPAEGDKAEEKESEHKRGEMKLNGDVTEAKGSDGGTEAGADADTKLDEGGDAKSVTDVAAKVDIDSTMVPIIASAHMATARAEMGLLQGCFDAGLYVQATMFGGSARDKASRLAAIFEQEAAAAAVAAALENGEGEGGRDADISKDENTEIMEIPHSDIADPRKDLSWDKRDVSFLRDMSNRVDSSCQSVLEMTSAALAKRNELLERMGEERKRRQALFRAEEENRRAKQEAAQKVEMERQAREKRRLQLELEEEQRKQAKLESEMAEMTEIGDIHELNNSEIGAEADVDVDARAQAKEAGDTKEGEERDGGDDEADAESGDHSGEESEAEGAKNDTTENHDEKEEEPVNDESTPRDLMDDVSQATFSSDPELEKLRKYRNADELLAKNLAGVYSQLMLLVSGRSTHASSRAANALRRRYGAFVPSLADVMAAKTGGTKLEHTVMGGVGKGGQRAEQCSVRAELFPMVPRFAADEALYWIQWALASTNGLGFGFMAHDGSWDKDVTYEYLREIRQMLIQVEKDIAPREVATRMLLSAALSKLSVQINHKADSDSYTKLFEQCAKEVDDPLYQAVACRFRLDYLEWEVFSQTAGEMLCKKSDNPDGPTPGPTLLLKHLGALQELLPKAKEYVDFASKCKDAHVMRDSLKRCANVYFEIDSMPDPYGSENPERGGEEEARNYDEMEMDLLESTEPVMLRKFSRYRGQLLIQRMRAVEFY